MKVNRIDHIVLTVKNIKATIEFYTNIMGMEKIQFAEERFALSFGKQKINLHELNKEFKPNAKNPKTGSADLCFIVDTPITKVIKELEFKNISIIEGPVERTGALGKITSVYFRDPDSNLIEVSNYN